MRDARRVRPFGIGVNNMDTQKRNYKTSEAAEYLGIKPNTLDIWRSKNRGPKFYRVGKNIIYLREDLDAYLSSRSVQTLDSINIKDKK